MSRGTGGAKYITRGTADTIQVLTVVKGEGEGIKVLLLIYKSCGNGAGLRSTDWVKQGSVLSGSLLSHVKLYKVTTLFRKGALPPPPSRARAVRGMT